MWLLFAEAGFALCLLIFIVWWTMFAGRKPAKPPTEKAQRSKRNQSERTE
jgi:hypothetical protein